MTTIVVLIFGEVSPKSIAKESPEQFAMFSAPFLNAFMVVLTPANYLFKQWKNAVTPDPDFGRSRHNGGGTASPSWRRQNRMAELMNRKEA